MKKTTLLQFVLLIAATQQVVIAQTAIQTFLSGTIRETPLIGLNTNANKAPNGHWLNQSFKDSAVVINPGILRYPGGTNANYWDWKLGWYLAAFPHQGAFYITPTVFKDALQATTAKGIYVLNYRNSTIDYQMEGLRHISSLGLPIDFIEIGNEHNIVSASDANQYVNPSIYGADCKIWSDSIKKAFPNAKIGLVGGSNGNVSKWHTPILNQNPNFDAFIWHYYINANNADLVFDVNRALASAFYNSAFRFSNSNFPANKDVWVTEYNLWETQPGGSSKPVIANTWTHALYVTAMNHFMLTKPEIKMFLNHSLTSIDDYHAAINRTSLQITANGVAMKLLLDVAKNSETSQEISFNPSLTLTDGTTNYPKLIGWKFGTPTKENGFICNFSPDTFTLSLASSFGQVMQFDQYYADTQFVVDGLNSVTKYTGNSNDIITIYPYSITQINSNPAPLLGINDQQKSNYGLWVYPNPSKEIITVQTNEPLVNAEISIYNMVGQEVLKLENISGHKVEIAKNNLPNGTYILKIKNKNEFLTIKLTFD